MDRDYEKQMAQTALEFMKRVDLKGSEVGPFVAVSQWLMGYSEPVVHDEAPKNDQPVKKPSQSKG
jgi:hypothetical protein